MSELARKPAEPNSSTKTVQLSGEALAQLIRALPRVITGDGLLARRIGDRWILEQSDEYIYASDEVQYFVVVSEDCDFLNCVSFSYTNQQQDYDNNLGPDLQNAGLTGTMLAVAKPQWLQQSIWSQPTSGDSIIAVDNLTLTYKSLDVNRRLVSPVYPGSILTNATNTTPIVITSASHGLVSGMTVTVLDVAGNTAANGVWVVLVVDTNNFQLVGSAGNGSFVENVFPDPLASWTTRDYPLPYRKSKQVQVISPPYMMGSIIAAKSGPTGLFYALTGYGQQPIQWSYLVVKH